MKYTLVATVLLALLLAGPAASSTGKDGDRAETRPDRREVQRDQRTTRDDARDLAILRDIQVELARARIDSDHGAVAELDGRVLAMLRNDRRDAADEQRQDEGHARVAAEWVQLESHYEREHLERRVILLDQLVDIARAESRQN